MNLIHLAAFREVMLSGSVSQAARNLHRSQPAISATIAALEAELGIQLFERKGKRLTPVPEAHYLLSEANDILDRVKTAELNMRNLSSLTTGELSIVSMPGPSVFLIPELLSGITGKMRDSKVRIITRSSPQVAQLISTQSYDVGIADLGVRAPINSALVETETFASTCVCALHRDDPLAARPVIRPADLDGRPMAALHETHASTVEIQRAFEAAGARFDLKFETQYYLPLLPFVEAGQATSIIDSLSAASYLRFRGAENANVAFRPFEPDISMRFATMVPAHRPRSQLAQAFISAWREEVIRINELWAPPVRETA